MMEKIVIKHPETKFESESDDCMYIYADTPFIALEGGPVSKRCPGGSYCDADSTDIRLVIEIVNGQVQLHAIDQSPV